MVRIIVELPLNSTTKMLSVGELPTVHWSNNSFTNMRLGIETSWRAIK